MGSTAIGEASSDGYINDYSDGYSLSTGVSLGKVICFSYSTRSCKANEVPKCGPRGGFKKDPPSVKHDINEGLCCINLV